MTVGRLSGELFDECAEWIWEQMQEDGFFLSGELVDLILKVERELGVQTRPPVESAGEIQQAMVARGVEANPYPLTEDLVRAVLEWEDEFLGFAGIPRAEA